MEQTLPRLGVEHAIHFVQDEIGGFLNGNATTWFHAARYALPPESNHPFTARRTVSAALPFSLDDFAVSFRFFWFVVPVRCSGSRFWFAFLVRRSGWLASG
jgi:hypothetical protein